MRVALLGDVHANLPALEAVLVDAEHAAVDGIWNTGDWLGYNAFPDEVVQRLRAAAAWNIAGNYDRKVLAFPEYDAKWKATKHPLKYESFRWSYEALSEGSRTYLSELPSSRRFVEAEFSILLCHGSPASVSEHLYPDTASSRFSELARQADADIVVFGHSHVPFDVRVDGTWFINPGSVGRQDDGDPRASYAILTLEHEPQLEFRRLEYAVERATAGIARRGLPPEFAAMVRRGRNLNWILAHAAKSAPSDRTTE